MPPVRKSPSLLYGWAAVLLCACGANDADGASTLSGGTGGASDTGQGLDGGPTSAGGSATANADGSDGPDATDASDGGEIFDVGAADSGGPSPACVVTDDMDGIGDCKTSAPPDSFEPELQWAWEGDSGDVLSYVIPLVANLTDDNGDGAIDLCDVPDVVVVATPSLGAAAHIYLLDGATGAMHRRFDNDVAQAVSPALGDLDGDGIPEIIAGDFDGGGPSGLLVAFKYDGTVAWTTSVPVAFQTGEEAIALGDLDNDGSVEVVIGDTIFDHEGQLVLEIGLQSLWTKATVLADLDDDDDLELIVDHRVFHHDGTLLWDAYADIDTASTAYRGYPQVGNLDDDPEPEVLFTAYHGIAVFEHDGTVKYQGARPTGDPVSSSTWRRPATIHDFDGDGEAEFAMSSNAHYSVFEGDGTVVWTASVQDASGGAGGTAFDFLGDGIAEAMYADEVSNVVFDGNGDDLLNTPRTSRTGIEYPIVADVDNDGSAEVIVVSNDSFFDDRLTPTVQVIRDVEDRWIQARRIWNQHTYHVTNVREDGTIPQVEPHHWELLNTFRTNAQIEGGGVVCMPVPAG